MTTSAPPATTVTPATGASHPKKKAQPKKHHRPRAAAHAKKAAAATALGTATNTAQTGPLSTVTSGSSSSSAIPRIAIFASIAAASLVLLAAIALGVSMLVSRGRPGRKTGGGNILIR